MVGLPVQAGCGDEARIIVSTGMQQNEVTGKGLILHNLHNITHLQVKCIQATCEKFCVIFGISAQMTPNIKPPSAD